MKTISLPNGHISAPPLDLNSQRVFVVGFDKTGTSCVKLMLETLYHAKCLHWSNVVNKSWKEIDQWIQLLQHIVDKPSRQRALRCILQDYQLAAGFPVAAHLNDLLEMYPTAKFILTVRNAEPWLATIRSTTIPKRRHPSMFAISEKLLCPNNLQELYEMTMRAMLDPSANLKDDAALLHGYVQWNEHVERVVPSNRLLVYNIKDGWEPLCKFLQLPVPSKPFVQLRRRSSSFSHSKVTTEKLLHLFICCFIYILFAALLINWIR